MNFQIFNQILLSIYPAAAVSSQSLLDLSAALLLISLLFLLKNKKEVFVFNKIGIEWAFSGYVVVVILGFWLNSSPDAEWKRTAIRFSWLLNIYILVYGLQTIQLSSSRVLKVLSGLTLGPTIYSLISYSRGFDLITGRDNSRITGLVNSATYHAHGNALLFVFMVSCLYFSLKKLNNFWKVFGFISSFLLGLSILLTFTRGIWISIFVSSVLVLFYIDWKKLTFFFVTSLSIFLISLVIWPKFSERVNFNTSLASTEERVSLLKLNLQMFQEYPLLGIGYGENLRRSREYWDKPEWNKPQGYITSHAHNQYVNVLATTGILGFCFFCSFFFYFLIKNIRLLNRTSRFERPETWALLIACLWAQLEFVIACVTDISFEYAKIRALILMVWALVIVIERKPSVVKELKVV